MLQDDIPEDYRLLTCEEFLANRKTILNVMSEWCICLLTGERGARQRG